MSIAFVQSFGAQDDTSGTTVATASTSVTAGNLLIAIWTYYHTNVSGGDPSTTISDGVNTWTQNVGQVCTGQSGVIDGQHQGCAYCINSASASRAVTFTIGDARTAKSILVLEYSGAGAFDMASVKRKDAANPDTITTDAWSLAEANELVLAFAGTLNTNNYTDFSVFQINGSTPNIRDRKGSYVIVGDRTASTAWSNVTATATQDNYAQNLRLSVVAFKEASAAAASPSLCLLGVG